MLSVLMLATVGFSVSRHYCLGMLKTERFYAPAEKCAGEDEHHHESEESIVMDCCADEFFAVPGLQVQSQVQENALHTIAFIAPASFQIPLKVDVLANNQEFLPPSNAPPKYGRDLLIHIQRFLI